ncbi:MAG: hypothetical protein DMG96_01770 [Acidobacteria bacterium]|nr:MAG: hypothetical protein DMG96_01770 [Acidobacteriota bacterium]
MHKPSLEVVVGCGIDVSAKELAVVVVGSAVQRRTFANCSGSHRLLIRWLQSHARPVRVCLEATGLYSLDLALALHAADGIEIAVLNPNTYTVSHLRCAVAQPTPPTPWCWPSTRGACRLSLATTQRSGLRLRAMTCYVTQLLEQQSMQTSRLHAAMRPRPRLPLLPDAPLTPHTSLSPEFDRTARNPGPW